MIDTRENEDIDIFLDCMVELHCRHLQWDIDQYIKSIGSEMVDNTDFAEKMADKWSINLSTARKLADIINFATDKQVITTEQIIQRFGISSTTAKRYLRQLTSLGYLEAQGGNRNRTYKKI